MGTPEIKNLSFQRYMNYLTEKTKNNPKGFEISEGKKEMKDVLYDLADISDCQDFERRLTRYLSRCQYKIKPFESGLHKRQFKSQIARMKRNDKDFLAAIYLLTAEEKTWNAVREYVTEDGIKYDLVNPVPTNDGYTLFQLARDITQGTNHITLKDISNLRTIKPQMFLVICKALAITSFGSGAIGIVPEDNDEGVIIFNVNA